MHLIKKNKKIKNLRGFIQNNPVYEIIRTVRMTQRSQTILFKICQTLFECGQT